MRGCLFATLAIIAIVVALAFIPAGFERSTEKRLGADAHHFATAISTRGSRPAECRVDRPARRIYCVAAGMTDRDIDLFAGAIVDLSQEPAGLQLDGRTLDLDGWTWMMFNLDGYGVAHDF